MISKHERGTREARLAIVRLGLFSVTAFVLAILLSWTVYFYTKFSEANDAPGVDYSVGDYIGDVGGVIIPTVIIIVVAALMLNFGYTFWLNSQEESGEE